MTTLALPAVRLLAGYHESGRPAGLRDHLTRYGPPPAASAEEVVRAVEEAGLTGRNGDARPVGRELRAAAGRAARVVVDAADREPASEKDRLLLAVAPHLVLDGAALAASAVGAQEIVLRVRANGTAAARGALADRERAGLGGTPAWVRPAGEDGAVRRLRPYEPMLVVGAETCAHVALIARYGAAWFRSCGSEETPGTALFTVSGAVVRPGVVEAPAGTSAGDLLDLAGGPAEPVQAILAGGHRGGWLPPALLDAPATPALLARTGVTLGPGVVVALPARACGLAESARVLSWLAGQDAGDRSARVGALVADFAALAAGTAGPAVLPVPGEIHRR